MHSTASIPTCTVHLLLPPPPRPKITITITIVRLFLSENKKSVVLDERGTVHWEHHAVRVVDTLGRRLVHRPDASASFEKWIGGLALSFGNLHRVYCWQCEWEDGTYCVWSCLTHGRYCTVLCVPQFKALRSTFSHSLLLVTADGCLLTIRTS